MVVMLAVSFGSCLLIAPYGTGSRSTTVCHKAVVRVEVE